MLKAEGSYILPDNVPANEFLNLESDKISTSRNWAVWLHEYLETFKDMQDVLRYTLTSITPETKDADFTWLDFQSKNNNELLAIFGNFVNRTVVLTHKFYNGKVPEATNFSDSEKEIIAKIGTFPTLIGTAIEKFKFREALAELMNLARIGNKYLTDTEPWQKQKENPEEVKRILFISLQICASLSILCKPFLPFTSKKLQQMLNIQIDDWQKGGEITLLPAQHQINKPIYLFEKIDDKIIEEQIQKLNDTKQHNLPKNLIVPEGKEDISFDEFQKVDLRIATILAAEAIPKTKKLLKLKVDTGIDVREVVSGIAEYYKPETLIGKQILMLANLTPKNIKGVDSHGMILMAENEKGELMLVQPSQLTIPGSTVK
jgi:methionyl-tRNA synthetase